MLDLLSHPPTEDKYPTLKTRLLETFDLSEQERLLHLRPLRDSKPSTLMDEMLALLGDHPPCFIFKQLFLERLPDDIRAQLVDSKKEDCRLLARRADALWTSRDLGSNTHAVERHPRPTLSLLLQVQEEPFVSTTGNLVVQPAPCTWQGNEQAGRQ